MISLLSTHQYNQLLGSFIKLPLQPPYTPTTLSLVRKCVSLGMCLYQNNQLFYLGGDTITNNVMDDISKISNFSLSIAQNIPVYLETLSLLFKNSNGNSLISHFEAHIRDQRKYLNSNSATHKLLMDIHKGLLLEPNVILQFLINQMFISSSHSNTKLKIIKQYQINTPEVANFIRVTLPLIGVTQDTKNLLISKGQISKNNKSIPVIHLPFINKT